MKHAQKNAGEEGKPVFSALYTYVIPPSFLSFRLVYIPAAMLTHSGHGLVWLNALLGILLTCGGEWLARHSAKRRSGARRDLAIILLSLLLVGLFPEESPIALILWTAIGLAWGEWGRGSPVLPPGMNAWIGLFLGIGVGLTGLLGPGSWLMALLLTPLLWLDKTDAASPTL
jgi:hypothetical protein